MNQLYSMAWHALFILYVGRPLDAEAILSVMPGTIVGAPNIGGC
ncbi:hypothetical protein [Paraburkholderia sp. Tr-20389]|nr:hypothetical protein [Paraburkholderia sp. Tr-20389]